MYCTRILSKYFLQCMQPAEVGKLWTFYKKLAEDNRGKVRYFYTGSGANNTGAKNALINTLNFYKANDNKQM